MRRSESREAAGEETLERPSFQRPSDSPEHPENREVPCAAGDQKGLNEVRAEEVHADIKHTTGPKISDKGKAGRSGHERGARAIGFLGGAEAIQTRVSGSGAILMVLPLVLGVLAWAGVWLRDERLRDLISLWTSPTRP